MKVAQSRLTLCDLMVYTVHGILLARILGWVAFPFSKGSSQPRDWTQVSRSAGRFFTSWAPSEAQEYWSGLPILSPADLPEPGIELGPLASQVYSLPTEPSWKRRHQSDTRDWREAKNTGVGSLSLLQGIFLTQESNWDPLHCRQMLYQLNYQGSRIP